MSTRPLTARTQHTIERVNAALTDNPVAANEVVATLKLADHYMQESQTVLNNIVWTMGLALHHDKPLAGTIEEQILFMPALIAMVKPVPETAFEVESALLSAIAALKLACAYATKARLLLNEAGDAPH